jgi:hypothetical protein
MAKQSPKDPKFRCNVCKKYYYASDHPVHYQCPEHGYLCEAHVGNPGILIYGHNEGKNRNMGNIFNEMEKPNPGKNPYFDKIIELPSFLIGKCLCGDSVNKNMQGFFYDYNYNSWAEKHTQTLDYLFEVYKCKKTTVKFVWNDKVQRWLEEGRDNEEDFITKQNPKQKSNQNNLNAEIKLLVNLFEKNILDKSQFLEQLKSKL